MKKLLSLFLSLLFIFAVSGCVKNSAIDVSPAPNTPGSQGNDISLTKTTSSVPDEAGLAIYPTACGLYSW